MHKRVTNNEYLGTTPVERSTKDGRRIALSSVAYRGANPEFRWKQNAYPFPRWEKVSMGVPYTRVSPRLTEVRAYDRAARLNSLPARRTKI